MAAIWMGAEMRAVGAIVRATTDRQPMTSPRWTRSWPGTGEFDPTRQLARLLDCGAGSCWGQSWSAAQRLPARRATGRSAEESTSARGRPEPEEGLGMSRTFRVFGPGCVPAEPREAGQGAQSKMAEALNRQRTSGAKRIGRSRQGCAPVGRFVGSPRRFGLYAGKPAWLRTLRLSRS